MKKVAVAVPRIRGSTRSCVVAAAAPSAALAETPAKKNTGRRPAIERRGEGQRHERDRHDRAERSRPSAAPPDCAGAADPRRSRRASRRESRTSAPAPPTTAPPLPAPRQRAQHIGRGPEADRIGDERVEAIGDDGAQERRRCRRSARRSADRGASARRPRRRPHRRRCRSRPIAATARRTRCSSDHRADDHASPMRLTSSALPPPAPRRSASAAAGS